MAKNDSSTPSPYYIYDDVQYIPKGNHHFDSLVDSISSTVKPDTWKEVGGRSKPVSGTSDGERRGSSTAGGGQGRSQGTDHFSEIEEYYDGELSRWAIKRAHVRKFLDSTKKLIKDETDVEDMIRFSSRTPEERPGAPRPEPAVADPFPAPNGKTLTDGTSATILNTEVDEKVIAELSKFKAEVVDGDTVALAVRVVTGKEAGPEVIEGFLKRSKDGRGVGPGQGGDRYQPINENRFLGVGNNPLSTFSIDVDTASYSKCGGCSSSITSLPPPDAVRLEEFINYHVYNYAGPEPAREPILIPGNTVRCASCIGSRNAKAPKTYDPFAAHVEVAGCPWDAEHRLVRIGIKGREMRRTSGRRATWCSWSMSRARWTSRTSCRWCSTACRQLVARARRERPRGDRRLRRRRRPGAALHAGRRARRRSSTALARLQAGGSTTGGAGIQLAYEVAPQAISSRAAPTASSSAPTATSTSASPATPSCRG